MLIFILIEITKRNKNSYVVQTELDQSQRGRVTKRLISKRKLDKHIDNGGTIEYTTEFRRI